MATPESFLSVSVNGESAQPNRNSKESTHTRGCGCGVKGEEKRALKIVIDFPTPLHFHSMLENYSESLKSAWEKSTIDGFNSGFGFSSVSGSVGASQSSMISLEQ